MLLKAAEMDIEFMKVLQEGAKGCSLGHLSKGIHIFRETFAAISVLAIRARNIGVHIIDVARKEDAGMHLAPVGTHLLAVLAACVEVSHFVCAKDIVHVLGEFCLQRGHDGEFLAHEDTGEQLMGSSEDHGLLLEVLDMGALGEKLGHIMDTVAGLLGETVTGARENGGAHEDGHVGEFGDEFLHQREVLRAVVLSGDVDLQERDVDSTQVIVVAFGWVTDEQFTLRVVVFQPIFQGSAYEAASDNSNVNHCFVTI